MLQVRHLSVSLLRDGREIIRDLSFSLAPGDRAALIGEEGDGKSTLLRLLRDPALVADYAEYSGEIRCDGRAAYLPQLMPEALRTRSPRALLAPADPAARARLLAALRLPAALADDGRPAATLSGGEKVKLQLLLLLLAQPDVLLLDEPSGDLDLETVEWLQDFLCACRLPVLFASHDGALIRACANMVVHLEQVRRKTAARATVARLDYQDYAERRQRALAQQDRISRKEHADFAEKQARWRRLYQQVDAAQAAVPRGDPAGGRLLKKKMHSVQAQGRRLEREEERLTPQADFEEAILPRWSADVALPEGKVVLDLRLPALRAGDRLLARSVRLFVRGPRRVGIIGANGAGKTTLLRLIAAELLPRRDLAVSYMPQDYREALPGEMTPVEYLAPQGDKAAVTFARTCLGSMKLTAREMERPAAALSGGTQGKLLFLGMILRRSNVLVLDEPTRNFSPLSAPVIRAMLRAFPGAIISVSHDRDYLAEVCEELWELTPDGLRRRDGGAETRPD